MWTARATSGSFAREAAIDYGLSGPNLRGSGVEFDLRKAHPYLVYDQLEFDMPAGSAGDCYDRYLVRIEEMRQSVRLLRQCLDKIPGGADNTAKEPMNIADGKIVLPSKDKVLTSMEELIHQFILVTGGRATRRRARFISARRIPRANWAFTLTAKAGARPTG